MITLVAKFFAALNANSRPGEIGAGLACGVILALIPFGNLLWFLLFIVFFLLRLHVGTMLLVTALFKLFIGFTDPLLDTIGVWVLTHPGLYDGFTALYNIPFVPLTRFYNSLVTGGLLFGIIVWLPLYFVGKIAVTGYRRSVRDKIAESRLVKSIGKYPIVAKLSAAVRKASGVYKSWSS
jgi:uncharacterized protein (TIGR03546 family)